MGLNGCINICAYVGLFLQTPPKCLQIPVFLIALRVMGQRGQIGCSVPRRRACSVGAWDPRPAANRVTPDQQPIPWPRA